MSRLAARNRVEVSEFGRDMGLPFKKVIDGDPVALTKLAALNGCDANDLIAWSPHYVASRSYIFRGEPFHARGVRGTTVRGCPACLREDANRSDLPPHMSMSIRGSWLPKHSTFCHTHELSLVDLWKEKDLTRRLHASARLNEIMPSIMSGRMDGEEREATDFDEYVDQRLQNKTGSTWLHQHQLYASCVFCDLLGRALVRLEFPASQVDPSSRWGLYQMGYEIAREGGTAIRQALANLTENIGAPGDGPKMKYGDLYDQLSHDLTGDEYAPYMSVIRDYILDTWPVGAADDVMGEPVIRRRKHSVLTAAHEIGMDPRRLRKLLAEAGIINEDGDDRWDVFDADIAAPFLKSLNRHVSALELQSQLSLSRSQFDLLRKEGYLPPALSAQGHKPLWDLAEARCFVNDLLRGSEPVLRISEKWVDLAKASQRLKIRQGQIISLIVEGRLTRIGKLESTADYASILVHLDELESLLDRPDAPGMTIESFARSIGLKPPQAGRLIKKGHTPATIARNPRTLAEQHYMRDTDIAAFNAKFVTLRELALARGQSWQSLRGLLNEKEVPLFSPDGLDYGLLYQRKTLDAFQIGRGDRTRSKP